MSGVLLLGIAGQAGAEDARAAEHKVFLWGGDVRVRQEAFDHIPLKTGGESRGGLNDAFRVRTRLWASVAPTERWSLNVRLLQEFRNYVDPSDSTSYEWPDELIVDHLNLSMKTRDGRVEAVAGRQEVIIEGAKALLGEGTAKDGSRSTHMDALMVVIRDEADRTRLSVFGLYDNAEDPLAIGGVHRDLNGYGSHDTDMDEAGAGVFLRRTFLDSFRATAYYLWKHDTAWKNAEGVRQPNEDIHTVGGRMELPLWEGARAGAEVAGQWSPTSESHRRAMMAALNWRQDWAEASCKPWVGVQGLYLSGDEASTEANESWNPLWSRYPWISELMIYAYDADGGGMWNNLIYTWLEGGVTLAPGHRIYASAGPMLAPEPDGAGGGHDRGWLGACRYDFPLWRSDAGEAVWSGHVLATALCPGSYYPEDELAWFLRWGLTFAF